MAIILGRRFAYDLNEYGSEHRLKPAFMCFDAVDSSFTLEY